MGAQERSQEEGDTEQPMPPSPRLYWLPWEWSVWVGLAVCVLCPSPPLVAVSSLHTPVMSSDYDLSFLHSQSFLLATRTSSYFVPRSVWPGRAARLGLSSEDLPSRQLGARGPAQMLSHKPSVHSKQSGGLSAGQGLDLPYLAQELVSSLWGVGGL